MMNIPPNHSALTKDLSGRPAMPNASLGFVVGRKRLTQVCHSAIYAMVGMLLLLFLLPVTAYAQTGVISGTVTNGNNEPLPDVNIQFELYDPIFESWNYATSTYSDEQGNYQAETLDAGSYRISFYESSGNYFSPQYYLNTLIPEEAEQVEVAETTVYASQMVLMRSSRLVGAITDSDSNPLESISVQLHKLYTPTETIPYWGYMGYAYTDVDGNYAFGSLEPGTYRIYVSDPAQNYLPIHHENAIDFESATDIVLGAEATMTVGVSLQTAAHLVGQVINSNGDPVENIRVYAHSYNTETETWFGVAHKYTNANGDYDIGGLVAGTYRVGFEDDFGNYTPLYHLDATTIVSATDVVLSAGATFTVNATLQNASRVVGQITNSDGDPLPNIGISILSFDDLSQAWTSIGYQSTDGNGYYQAGGLTSGTYRLEFYENSGAYVATQYYNNAFSIEDATDVAIGSSETITINPVLQRASYIAGKVTNSNGDPVEGVSIYVYTYQEANNSFNHIASGYSDANGDYTVGGLAAGTYHLGFTTGGSEYIREQFYPSALYLSESDGVTVSSESTSTVDMTLMSSATLAGTVTEALGNPLAGITVQLYHLYTPQEDAPYWQSSSFYIDTDENGHYNLSGILPGTYRVGFADNAGDYIPLYHAGASTVESATDVVLSAGETITVDTTLQPASHIIGTVTNGDGTPLQDIQVSVYRYNAEYEYWSSLLSEDTDASGNFDVGGLVAGTYRVGFADNAGDYIPLYHAGASTVESATDVVLSAGETITVDATLQPASHIIGTVTNEDGTPLQNVSIYVHRYDAENEYWSSFAYGYTDASGNYDVGGFGAGTYRVGFYEGSGEYFYWQYYPNTLSVDEAADVVVGHESTVTVDMMLIKDANLVGTLIDALGNAATDVTVRLYHWYTPTEGSPYWSGINSTYTDDNGNFILGGIEAGTYRVGFEDYAERYLNLYYENASDVESATDVVLSAGATITVDATLQLASHIIGTVTNGDGTPLQDIQVSVYRYNAEYEYWTSLFSKDTDASGNYDVGGLVAGTYRVGFADNAGDYIPLYHAGASTVESATDVVLGATATITVDATLQPASHIIGTVTNGDGTPLQDAGIYVHRYDAENEYWSSFAYGYTDASGNYDVGGLVAGTYRVGFYEGSGEYIHWQYYPNVFDVYAAADVEVGNVATVVVNMTMQRPASFAGTVTNASSAPIQDVSVTLYQLYFGAETPYWSIVNSTETDANGQYHFASIAPGEYRIGFTDYSFIHPTQYYNGKASVEEADTVTLVDGEARTLDAQLAEYASISGQVSDPNGNGIANVTIYAYRAFTDSVDGSLYWSCCYGGNGSPVATDENGDYYLPGLEGGTYRLQFYPLGGSGYYAEYYDNAADVASATDIVVSLGSTIPNIDAQLGQGGMITGVVTDFNGQPLANADVTLYNSSFYWANATSTDSSGTYTLTGVSADIYRVMFSEANHSTEYYNDKLSLMTADPLTITIDTQWHNINAQLSTRAAITGTVFGPSNTPLANQSVYLYVNSGTPESPSWNSISGTTTDVQGNYTFDSLSAGVYRIKFDSDLYQDEYYNDKPTLESADDIVLQPGITLGGINAHLVAGGEISGLVTNDLGESIAHSVTLYRQQINPDSSVSWIYESGYSFATGNYSIKGITAGTYRLLFQSSCCSTIYYPNAQNVEQASNIVVGEQAIVPNINVQLARGGAISGTVMNASSATLSEISITIYRQVIAADNSISWQYASMTWTDNSGNYLTSDLPAGIYRLYFSDWMGFYLPSYYNGTAEFETAKNVVVTSGNTTSNINTTLIDNGSINGKVLNGNAEGLSDITVRLYEDHGSGWVHIYSVRTSNDGTFSMKVTRAGNYRLGFADEYGTYARHYYTSIGSASRVQDAETIPLVGKETISLNDVVLSLAGSISGVVRNSDNMPLAGIAVRAYHAGSSTAETIGTIGVTNGDGSYQITGLNSGDYHLYFGGSDNLYGTRFYSNAITIGGASPVVVISEQNTPNIDMVLPFAVAPVGQVESTHAQISSDPNTGELTISMGRSGTQDITIVRNVSCPNEAPLNVTLTGGAKAYAMSENPVGSGVYKVVIPQADFELLNGTPLVLTYDCIDPITSTPTPAEPTTMGKIVLYDPSGFVTDADTGAPIVGATARLYHVPGWQPRTGVGDTRENTCQSHSSKDVEDPWSQPAPVALGVLEPVGSGRMDPNVNPQITNSQGRYAWNVAEGCWYVTVEAEGYLPVVSAVVGVPPEVTDLDLTMERSTVAAAFSANILSGPAPLTVSFTDQSLGPVSAWEWHFGDGATSTVENPAYIYTQPGIYTVWLKVTGAEDSNIYTRTSYIHVTDAAISGLVANNNGPTTLGNPTQFNATISAGSNANYLWSFGDGAEGTGANPSHTYTSPGSYTAIVTATNSANSVSATTTAHVLDVAVGTLTLEGPTTIIMGQPVTFTVTASSGTNVAFAWEFEGASHSSIAAISLQQVTHLFDEAGTYAVKVTASNSAGNKVITKNFVVKDVAIGGLSIQHSGAAMAGQSTTLRASTLAGTNVTYSWKLGDGTTATGAEVNHIYATPGNYVVEVTAANSNNSQSATANLIVSEEDSSPGDTPITGLSIVLGDPKLNAAISFEAKINTGNNVIYVWDFGDGTTGNGKVVSHSYTNPGTYVVKVTASNSANNQSATANLVVPNDEPGPSDTPIAGLTIVSGAPQLHRDISFEANITAGDNVVYAWNFGDGATASGKSVSHTYTTPGTYRVQVTAKNAANQLTAFTEIKIDEIGGNTVEAITGLSAAGPSQGWVGNTVTFNAGVTAGDDVIFTWDFGDGKSATGEQVSHTFAQSGRFTVTVTASNSLGSKALSLQVDIQHGNFMPQLMKK